MLVDFSVHNFRSIKGEACLSLAINPVVKDYPNNVIDTFSSKYGKYLKSAVLYGVNGAGKSNLLLAFYSMRNIILTGHKKTLGDPIKYDPFLLDRVSQKEPTTFTIRFVLNDTLYEFGFSHNGRKILSEFLNAYPKQNKQEWYSRHYNAEKKKYDWKFSPLFKGEKESIKQRTLDNVLFISKAAQENHPLISEIMLHFQNDYFFANERNNSKHTSQLLHSKKNQSLVIDFIKSADLGLHDIVMEEQEIDRVLYQGFDDEASSAPQTVLIPKSIYKMDVDEQTYKLDFNTHESLGIKKLFSLSGIILKTLNSGGVLFIDEIENNLNIKIINYIIDIFHDKKTNPKSAQIIFTTHNPIILETNQIRRDQILFAAKNDFNSSVIYNLSRLAKFSKKFKSVRKDQNLLKGYLQGKFYEPPEPEKEAVVKIFSKINFPQLDLFDRTDFDE